MRLERIHEPEKKILIKSARIIEVIELDVLIGKGTDDDPNRIQKEYWSKDGELLALNDPEINPYGIPPSLQR